MDFATIQANLVTAVQTALGDVSADVTWVDRTNGWRSTANVKLQVIAFKSIGRGERRYADSGVDDLQERIYGPRRFTVQFMCETQDQDLAASALANAETIAARFESSDVDALLDAAGLGVAQISEVRQVNRPDGHDRVRSVAVFDIRFNAHTSITGPIVERLRAVEISGTVENGPDTGPTVISETGWTAS